MQVANVTPAGNQATNPSEMENLTISFLPNATHLSWVGNRVNLITCNNQPTRREQLSDISTYDIFGKPTYRQKMKKAIK